jgi:hypothetical protein
LIRIFIVFNSITRTEIYFTSTRMLYEKCLMLWSLSLNSVERKMPRFRFSLKSKDSHIPDDGGKELASLNDAYDHARKLIEKIWLHTGHEDLEEWSIIISNEELNVALIVPCSFSYFCPERQRVGAGKDSHQLGDNEDGKLRSN